MKKTLLMAALASTALLSNAASASDGEHNVLLGYAKTSSTALEDFDMIGLNVKYAFEPYGQNTGFISSFSRTSNSENSEKMTYTSIMMGPSYYVTDFAAVYAMGGIGSLDYQASPTVSHEDTGFAAAVGFKMNVYKELVLDTTIEYTPIDYDGKTADATSFSVSIGGRF